MSIMINIKLKMNKLFINMIGKVFCIVLSVFVAYCMLVLNNMLDITKELQLHGHESCEKVKIIETTEDLAVFEGIIIGATGEYPSLFFKHLSALQAKPGSLIAINPITKESYKIKINNFPSNFEIHGHGIKVENNTLYVLSHSYKQGGEIIFIFELELKEKVEASFVKIIKFDGDFGLYNSIAFVNKDSFYITQ